jgi:hypothetical protein
MPEWLCSMPVEISPIVRSPSGRAGLAATFVASDKQAVSLIAEQGQQAKLLA